ncbi:MAG: ABC transporter ATP-binding protein [Candidatus Omnitrophica bacterium]|nr:ABC transporter ATP-binding protein [Candidatus Omnitrophota bacterium]
MNNDSATDRNRFAVTVNNLEKKFGSFTAVARISFAVRQGEIFGFLGPNGAGKSTTIRMLSGIIAPTAGSGSVGGFDIIREQDSIKQNIGYMSQKFSLYEDLTVEENIDFYSGIYRIPRGKKAQRKEWVLTMAKLEELRGHRTSVLSGGWKQRLALGCAIIHEPGIVFLDEPTSGVDPIARQNFWSIIKGMAKEGVTVFVTTHYMDEAENCDRLALIYKGAIIAIGSPSELKTNFMKEDVLKISVSEPEEWIAPLMKVPGVREAALFGTAIHAIVADSARAIPSIRELLGKASNASVRPIAPSLEDVFVSLIETYDKNTGVMAP